MTSTHTLRRGIVGLATTVLVSGGLGLAGLGLVAGTAHAANGRWCPGQDMGLPTGPGRDSIWDMSVCHDWWQVRYGQGNVPNYWGSPSAIWADSPPPPPPPPGPELLPGL
jgi:hypothetical protein